MLRGRERSLAIQLPPKSRPPWTVRRLPIQLPLRAGPAHRARARIYAALTYYERRTDTALTYYEQDGLFFFIFSIMFD